MYRRSLAALLISAAFVAPAVPAAAALDASKAAQALGDALTKGTGGKVSFAKASSDGANIVVDGLALTSHDSSDTVTFAKTVIENPTEGGAGVFSAPHVAMTDGVVSGDSAGTVASASLTNVTVMKPTADTGGDAFKPAVLFDSAEALGISVGPKDKPYKVTVARLGIEMSDIVDNSPQASKGSVEQIVVPPEAFADADFKPSMLGYDKVVLGISWDGSRDAATKIMTLRDLTLAMENGGSLKISAVLGNMPDPAAMQRAHRAAAASEIIIHSATVRYEDNSLAGKILDMQAQKQGVSRDAYAAQISGALPFLLAALNNPPFQNQVSTALAAFLQNPQSMTITVAPDPAVTGAEIMQIVGSAPQTLPDRLKVGVAANGAP